MKAKSTDDIQAQLDRLTKMKDGKMKSELKLWLNQRMRILSTLLSSTGGDGGKDELQQRGN